MKKKKKSTGTAAAGLALATLLIAGAATADLRRAGERYEIELPAFIDVTPVLWTDVSNIPQSFETSCDVAVGGEPMFLRFLSIDTGDQQYSALAVRPEVVFDHCPVPALPNHVTSIRVESLCDDEPVVLTTFDGSTVNVPFGPFGAQVPVLVAPAFDVPECDRVAHRVVIVVDPPGAEHMHTQAP